MSRIALLSFGGVWHNRVFSGASVSRLLAVLLSMLTILTWVSTSASAGQMTSPTATNVFCVGDTITVSVTGVTCTAPEGLQVNVTALVGNTQFELSGSGGSWSGSTVATIGMAGTPLVKVSDSCGDDFSNAPIAITVVKLTDTLLQSEPTGSVWKKNYGANPNRDYTAVKSPTQNDVVTFGLDITPNTALAGSKVTWSGATEVPGSNHLAATVYATNVGKTTVTANACNFTTTNRIVWIFWAFLAYNTNAAFDTNDTLQFTTQSGMLDTLPDPRTAGFYDGPATDRNGNNEIVAAGKCEIIATLQPSGVGNIVTNDPGFRFGQTITTNTWSLAAHYNDNDGFTGSASPVNDGGFPTVTPANDKMFAIDAPGPYVTSPDLGWIAMGCNFSNYLYIGSNPVSDIGLWHCLAQLQIFSPGNFQSRGSVGSNNVTLPTTWGGF